MRTAQDGLASEVNDLRNLVASLKEDKDLPRMEQRMVALSVHLEGFHEKLQAFELMEKVMQDREKRAEEIADAGVYVLAEITESVQARPHALHKH